MGESDRVSVLVKSPKYRRPINVNQDHILKILFKFRFVSCELLGEFLVRDKSSVYENLYVLVNQGYVVKRYDSSYRLRLRPAIYYLSAKAVAYLLDNSKLPQSTLRGMYQNGSKSDEYIDRCLLIMRLYLKFNRLYPNQFDIFSKTELTPYDQFLRPLSDLYLQSNTDGSNYLLEIVEAGQLTYLLRWRLWNHDYQADQEWDEDEYGSYPNVLLVAINDRTELRLLQMVENMFGDFEFYTTTVERLLKATTNNKAIWQMETEEDEFLNLETIEK